ncbi:hypothetical protein D3C81_1662780 [compost metagenome]
MLNFLNGRCLTSALVALTFANKIISRDERLMTYFPASYLVGSFKHDTKAQGPARERIQRLPPCVLQFPA